MTSAVAPSVVSPVPRSPPTHPVSRSPTRRCQSSSLRWLRQLQTFPFLLRVGSRPDQFQSLLCSAFTSQILGGGGNSTRAGSLDDLWIIFNNTTAIQKNNVHHRVESLRGLDRLHWLLSAGRRRKPLKGFYLQYCNQSAGSGLNVGISCPKKDRTLITRHTCLLQAHAYLE